VDTKAAECRLTFTGPPHMHRQPTASCCCCNYVYLKLSDSVLIDLTAAPSLMMMHDTASVVNDDGMHAALAIHACPIHALYCKQGLSRLLVTTVCACPC
jgi:hypothetical protein